MPTMNINKRWQQPHFQRNLLGLTSPAVDENEVSWHNLCSAVLFNSYQIPTNSNFFWTTNPLNISSLLCVIFLHALHMHPSGFALCWSLAYLTANFVPYNTGRSVAVDFSLNF